VAARAVIPVAALLAAACSGQQPPDEKGQQRVTSLQEIAGPWDIASFDGYEPMRLHEGVPRARVHVDNDRLSYVIECNYSGNRAALDETGTLHDHEGGRTQTLMGCAEEQSARDRAFFSFFASKPKVSWAGAKRVRISNGKTELLLERPELRRLAHLLPVDRLAGRWVPQMAMATNPDTGSTGESFRQPSLVVLGPSSLSYSGCGGVRFTFRYTGDGRMADVREQGRAECADDFASATLLRIMRSQPLVERDATGVSLTAGDLAVNLMSEAEVRRRSAPHSLPQSAAPAGAEPPPPPMPQPSPLPGGSK
jgi:heat shock protein HslJ